MRFQKKIINKLDPNFTLILINLGSNIQVSRQIYAFIYLRICDFHACIAFHTLKCDINILNRFFVFTTMISFSMQIVLPR